MTNHITGTDKYYKKTLKVGRPNDNLPYMHLLDLVNISSIILSDEPKGASNFDIKNLLVGYRCYIVKDEDGIDIELVYGGITYVYVFSSKDYFDVLKEYRDRVCKKEKEDKKI